MKLNHEVRMRVLCNSFQEALALAKGVAEVEGIKVAHLEVSARIPTGNDYHQALVQDDPTPAPAPEEEEVAEPEPVANTDAPAEEEEEEEQIIALPADLPYLGTLQSAGLTLDEIRDQTETGTIRNVKGIGDVAAGKLEEFFGVAAGEEEEEWSPKPADDPVPEETKEKRLSQAKDPDLAQIRSALARLGKAKGKGIGAVKRVLSDLGIQSLSEIEEEQYGEALALVEKELAG